MKQMAAAMLMATLFGPMSAAEAAELTVVYNNVPSVTGFATSWGFACCIDGFERTILFDTGGDGDLLLDNLRRAGIDPASIDTVVLSHIHGDHTGGLAAFLEAGGGNASVVVPASFPRRFKQGAAERCAEVVSVEEPREICRGVWTTGEQGRTIREQALVLQTERGLVVVTGCAHPGIVTMVQAARDAVGGEIDLVMGGFHLMHAGKGKIERVIDRLQELGVDRIAPSHCSGERAMELFEEAWGEQYLQLGCGATLTLER